MKLPPFSFSSRLTLMGLTLGGCLVFFLNQHSNPEPAKAGDSLRISTREEAAIPSPAILPAAYPQRTFRTVGPGEASLIAPAPVPDEQGGYTYRSFPGGYSASISPKGVTLLFEEKGGKSIEPLSLHPVHQVEENVPSMRVSGNRVEIERGSLTEWYHSTSDGLEQGFTLGKAPAGQTGNDLKLELLLSQGWTAEADAGDASVRYRNKSDGTELRYQNLVVRDAGGKKLTARLAPMKDGSGVMIHTSTLGAVFPITIDPLFTVLTVADLLPGESLSIGSQNPVIFGDRAYFPLFAGANSTSLGLWSAPLSGALPTTEIYTSRNTFNSQASLSGIIQGVLGDRLYFSSISGHLYNLTQDMALSLVKQSGGGGLFLSQNGGQARYLRASSPGLWKTDGTDGGTVQERSLSADPQPDALLLGDVLFYTSGNRLLFSGPGPSFGMLQDSTPDTTLQYALTLNGKVYFSSNGGISVTDGTVAGTVTLATGATMESAALFGNSVFFRKNERLWKTDGTVGGTLEVNSTVPVSGNIVVHGGSLYFHGSDGPSTHVWRSDGTDAGTVLFKSNAKIASAGGSLFYLLITTPEAGEELWVSDGTNPGTVLLKDITPGAASTGYDSFRHSGNFVLFRAGSQLWRSNGLPESTTPLFDTSAPSYTASGITNITPAGSKVFFSAYRAGYGQELWAANIATGVASEVMDINPGTPNSSPFQIKAFGEGTVLFFATQAGTGTELWRSNGTGAGTNIVKDLSPFTSVLPTEMIISGSYGWFFAPDASGNLSLCRTDGTEIGTVVLKTLPTWQSTPPRQLKALGNGVVFAAPGPDSAADRFLVWTSDGTVGGTQPSALEEIKSPSLMVTNGMVYIQGRTLPELSEGSGPFRIWSASGTPLNFQSIYSSIFREAFLGAVLDGKAYYSATVDSHTARIWQTDGSPNAPILFSSGKSPSLIAGSNKIFIDDLQQFTSSGSNSDLSVRDPQNPNNPEGNRLNNSVGFQNPGPLSPPASFNMTTRYGITPVGNYAFFRASKAGVTALWVTDGTAAGTGQVPQAGTSPRDLTSDGTRLFYVTSSPVYGEQLRMIGIGASLTVSAAPAMGGNVTGSLTNVLEPGVKPISAIPNSGFFFSHWEGGAITNPSAAQTSVAMQGPLSVTAIFKPIPQLLTDWGANYGLSGTAVEPYADPAGDGIANLLKLAFNMSPLLPASTVDAPEANSGIPAISVLGTGGDRILKIVYIRPQSGIPACFPEVSMGLKGWTAATAAPAVETLGTWEKVTILQPVPQGSPSYFGRVRVVLD